jgi:Amiloride-sensitive sodium channel
MFLMLLALTLFGVLMLKTTRKFNKNKIVLQLSTEAVRVGDIPFPAVTICPQIFYKDDLKNFDVTFTSPLEDKCATDQMISRTSAFIKKLFSFSEAFLQFTDFLQSQSVVNNDSRFSITDYLNSTTQTKWLFDSVFGDWKFTWSTPMQMILTKWGFCFSFNLMPLVDVLRFEK